MRYGDILEPPLEPPMEKGKRCRECGEGFCLGETLFYDEGIPMCEGCFKEWVWALLETSPRLLGERLGFDVEVSDGYA